MPYADPEKQKAYVRKWAREYYRRKKAEREKTEKQFREAAKLVGTTPYDLFVTTQGHTTDGTVVFQYLSQNIKETKIGEKNGNSKSKISVKS